MARRVHVFLPSALFFLTFFCTVKAQDHAGVSGDWREPGGSVVRVAPCGDAICARLVKLSDSAPSQVDGHNPDPAKRSRPLCGVQIGSGFHPTGPDHADDGQLYDPKSGKTYHGEMTSSGDTLKLRGYVGIKVFGRTESWTRVSRLKEACS